MAGYANRRSSITKSRRRSTTSGRSPPGRSRPNGPDVIFHREDDVQPPISAPAAPLSITPPPPRASVTSSVSSPSHAVSSPSHDFNSPDSVEVPAYIRYKAEHAHNERRLSRWQDLDGTAPPPPPLNPGAQGAPGAYPAPPTTAPPPMPPMPAPPMPAPSMPAAYHNNQPHMNRNSIARSNPLTNPRNLVVDGSHAPSFDPPKKQSSREKKRVQDEANEKAARENRKEVIKKII